MELMSTNKVANRLGISPGRVRQLDAARSEHEVVLRARPAEFPAPAQEINGVRFWDSRAITRHAAHREGGLLAVRAEAMLAHYYGIGAVSGNFSSILGYPDTAEFNNWLLEQREGGASV